MTFELTIDRWAGSFRTLSAIAGLYCLLAPASAEAAEAHQFNRYLDLNIITMSGLEPEASSGLPDWRHEKTDKSLLWLSRYQIPTANGSGACFDVRARAGSRIMDCTIALLNMREDDPGRASFYAHRALAYYTVNEWQIALQDFETSLSIDPDLPLALNGRCWILASRALDLAQAREDCDKALAADPSFHEAFDSRAIISMRETRWDAAWIDFNAAVSLHGGVATYIYGRGLASLALGAREAASRDLSTAIALRPEVALEYRDLGFDPALPPFQINASSNSD